MRRVLRKISRINSHFWKKQFYPSLLNVIFKIKIIFKYKKVNRYNEISHQKLSEIMYFEKFNLIYNKMRKSGSTNIILIIELMNDLGLKPDNSQIESMLEGLDPALIRKKRSLTVKNIPNLEHPFKFTFVRNPFVRAVSMFKDKIVGKTILTPNFKSMKVEDSLECFEQFLDYLLISDNYYNRHYMPQVNQLFFPLEKYDFIGRLENFNEDFLSLLKLMDYSPSESLKKLIASRINTHHITNSDEKYLKYYTPTTIQKVLQLYKEDFETFGYSTKLDTSYKP